MYRRRILRSRKWWIDVEDVVTVKLSVCTHDEGGKGCYGKLCAIA